MDKDVLDITDIVALAVLEHLYKEEKITNAKNNNDMWFLQKGTDGRLWSQIRIRDCIGRMQGDQVYEKTPKYYDICEDCISTIGKFISELLIDGKDN